MDAARSKPFDSSKSSFKNLFHSSSAKMNNDSFFFHLLFLFFFSLDFFLDTLFEYKIGSKSIGGEFPVQDVKTGQGGILKVCKDGINLLLQSSKVSQFKTVSYTLHINFFQMIPP